MELKIVIEKDPAFYEVWREGYVEWSDQKYYFWLIDPQRSNYEPEIRWYFKNVPREVRGMYNNILEAYKTKMYDNRDTKDNSDALPPKGGA